MKNKATNQKRRGGARAGAGRKPKPITIVRKATAEQVLAGIDETQAWTGILESKDMRVRLDALKYLTDRRDGKAAQAIEHSGPGGQALAAPVLNITFVKP